MNAVYLLLLISIIPLVACKKDLNLYCGACKAIMHEVDYSIQQVDPNKKIDVGSFRVDPNGKTRTVQKSYARSESHLTGLLERVCSEISDNYVESKDPETGTKR
nr:protein canopy homolog 2-like [Ciona intestinalis]|eukprot:XP_004225596.1 protein canopy homolog 2-like [Ciona intestinalis]